MISINNLTISLFNKDVESIKKLFYSFLGDEYEIRHNNQLMTNYSNQLYNAPVVEFGIFSPCTNPQTSVLIANIMDGYVNLIKHISKQYNLDFYHVVISESSAQILESYQFHYYSNSQCRHILCYQDPQWVFYETGDVLPFENPNHYKQRIKKNRLNKGIIIGYLSSLGWNIEDDNFWIPVNGFYTFSKK